ncbi:MAG: zinc ribbon domain-containing protein [Candidatus Thorarchaeota archaeon]
MKQLIRQSRKRERDSKSRPGRETTIRKYKYGPSQTKYLVESFLLNSEDRVVSRRGRGRKPNPAFRRITDTLHQLSRVTKGSGRKVNDLDLHTLSLHFERYVQVVNILLSRVYRSPIRAQQLGKKLSEYKGRAYTLLRNEKDLCYQHNDDLKALVYERLHRNALEQTGRMVLADFSRRELFNSAVVLLSQSLENTLSLVRRKRIPSALIRRIRDSCEVVKSNGSGYHYTIGVLRQIRRAIDVHILDTMGIKIGWRASQRKKVSSLLRWGSSDFDGVKVIIECLIESWAKRGYPFTIPKLKRYSLDFSASTENSTGQGYWFTLDEQWENEVLLHLKLPPGIDGREHDESPYRSKTLTLRFLDWLPRAASQDRRKATSAEDQGDIHRAEQLRFRDAKFSDMHQQLINTIQIQHSWHRLSKLKQRKEKDSNEILDLEEKVERLRGSRRSAPPRILLRGHRVVLQIPFLSPNGAVTSEAFGEREYTAEAGVDRGLRVPVALSVEKDASFEDTLITMGHLVDKRERLRKHAYRLTSKLARKKNNWDKKRSGQCYPAPVLKWDRHISALWRKVRRLDREIARQVASQTVWFCEEHRVKKLYFEDLRSFQAHAGSRDMSYNLSSTLWGKVIDTVRYMREQMGHSRYSVWTVNPRFTSQTCHKCGEKGRRVEGENTTTERKGGEYFYCSQCDEHFHADINAARNIIHVQQSSVVPGRTA